MNAAYHYKRQSAGGDLMGSEAISVRTEPVSGRQAAGQRRHDLRDPAQTPDYVDRSRSHLNSVLIEPPDPTELRAEIAQHREAAGQRRLRADARTAVRGVITFGTDAQPRIEALSKAEQDRLFRRVADEIAKESGHPLIGLVVHRDEAAIHAHYMLRGYRLDEQGREHPWRKTRAEMSRLQDVAAEVPEVKALGIQRGTPKAERIARGEDRSKVIHRTVRELHRDLPAELEQARKAADRDKATIQAEIEAVEAELEAQREKAEKNRRLIEEQEKKLAEQRVSEEQAQKRIETYERRETKALEEIEDLEARKAKLEADLQYDRKAAQADIARAIEAVLDGMRYLGVINGSQQMELMDAAVSTNDLVRTAIAFRDEAPSIARSIEAEKAKAIQQTREQAKEQSRPTVTRPRQRQQQHGPETDFEL